MSCRLCSGRCICIVQIAGFRVFRGLQANIVSRRVLLVEDNLDLLELAIDMLKLLGHEVIAARSGEDALDCLRSVTDLQILITDVNMPGMNGIELACRTRQMYPSLRVLLVSGRADSVMAEAASNHFDVLPKPYHLADFDAYLGRPSAGC